MSLGERVTRRYVLHEHPAEDIVERFAEHNDWDLVSRTPADEVAGTGYEVAWLTPVNLLLHYREDSIARQSYVFLRGDDFDRLDSYRERIERELSPWRSDELLRAVDDSPQEPDRSLAVLRAGLGAPTEFDERFFDVITTAMIDTDHAVRKVGVLAATYSPWPRYRPLLDRIGSADPDPETRNLAQSTLRAFDEHGIAQP